MSAEIAPKNIRLADKISTFGWNLADPRKIRRRRRRRLRGQVLSYYTNLEVKQDRASQHYNR